LRKITRRLGAVRELDVLQLLLEECQQDDRYSRPALSVVGAAIDRARDNARERLAAKLPALEMEGLAGKLEAAFKPFEREGASLRRPGVKGSRSARLWALEAAVARRADGVWEAIGHAGTVYAPHYLHEARIAFKKLRYAAELLEEAGRRRLAGDIAVLKAGQDLLGRLHDLEVLIAWVRESQASLSPPDLKMWQELGSLAHTLEEECRRLHASFICDRAKLIAIAARLRGPASDGKPQESRHHLVSARAVAARA
jgi:CHAD domain-containing protein